jgi:lipopolysaccharide export system protein LptC
MTDTLIPQAVSNSPPEEAKSGVLAKARQIRAGRGYSRFANSMRFTLPLIACVIAITVIAWPQLGQKPKRFSLGVSKVTVNDGGGQQIVNPRFTGTDSDNRPFTVTADAATQVQTNPSEVDLSFPRADITLASGAWLAVSAQSGLFDRKAQSLALKGAVNLFHDTGYELRTASADVDLAAGVATGTDPVTGQGPFGSLKSTGFQIFDRGKRVIFSGKSRLILYPSAEKPSGKKG